MRIRDIKETTQKGHIRAVKNFAAFLGRSPDTATPDELRAYQFLENLRKYQDASQQSVFQHLFTTA
jgi:hypothetical protein